MRNLAIARQDTAAHDPISRRNWLSSTGLKTVGLGALHQFWGAISQAGSQPNNTVSRAADTRRAKSVIMIFNCGAPSHIDLWDMKPNAPSELRGLLDETLVIWMGDFGRTPVINKDAGRDHWPQCYSMVLAGGGIRGGQVVGESDKTGAYPFSRPVTPADIHATVFAALGYDAQQINYHMTDGRPMPVCDGKVIHELI